MTADVGTFPRLPHLIPIGIVKELAFTGRRVFSKEAKEILIAASKNKDGRIMKSITLSKRLILVGNDAFGSKDQKSFVRYEAGLEQLLSEDFIKELGNKAFELTHKGHEMADAL